MQLPLFYHEELPVNGHAVLDETNSRHVVQVLRMGDAEQLLLTDGKGHIMTAAITEANKKRCEVRIIETSFKERTGRMVTIAVSLLKNASRFEWFLEKATELGIANIVPLLCERTEKQKFRSDRARSVCISAMLQSRQCWLPELDSPSTFEQALAKRNGEESCFIAHCMEGEKNELKAAGNSRILIGPEGDFTPGEISLALTAGFQPVSLGNTRLRTETAALVAATLLQLSV